MKSTGLQEIIIKISKLRKKIIHIDDLSALTNSFSDQKESSQKLYKMIYYLKQRGYLLSLKKDLFFVKDPNDNITENECIDMLYRKILSKHCDQQFQKKRYIGGEVALALHLHQYTTPDNILIINPLKQGYETLFSGKKIQCKSYSHLQQNITPKIMKHTSIQTIQGQKLRIANMSLALLESLYNNNHNNPLILDLIKKLLKKVKDFPIEEFHAILKLGKHHSSINHLYKIALTHNPKFAIGLSEVIKKWSFFG